jgi:hypothetical protein
MCRFRLFPGLKQRALRLSEAHKSILTGGVGCGYFFVQAEMQVRILSQMRIRVAKWQRQAPP